MRSGAGREFWRALGSRPGRAAITVVAAAGVVLAVVSFGSLFVGISRQLNGPVIDGPGSAVAGLATGRYEIYQRYTGAVQYDQEGKVIGTLHQPGQLTARDISITTPSGAALGVTDRGVGSSTLSEGARIYVSVARFETTEDGEHRFTLAGAPSELLLAKQSRFGMVTLILTAIAAMFVGIGGFLLRVMVQAVRPAPATAGPTSEPDDEARDDEPFDDEAPDEDLEADAAPTPAAGDLVSEPPRDPAHPGEA